MDDQSLSYKGTKTSLTLQRINISCANCPCHKEKANKQAPHSPLKIIARASTITQVLDAHKVVSVVADGVRDTALVHQLLPQQAASIRVRIRQRPVLVVLCRTPLTCMATRQSKVLQHQAIMQRRQVIKYTQGYSVYA